MTTMCHHHGGVDEASPASVGRHFVARSTLARISHNGRLKGQKKYRKKYRNRSWASKVVCS